MVGQFLLTNVDPLRGSEKMKTGVGVCHPMAAGIVDRGVALIVAGAGGDRLAVGEE